MSGVSMQYFVLENSAQEHEPNFATYDTMRCNFCIKYLLHLKLFVLLPESVAHAPLEPTVARLRRENTNVHSRPVTLKALGAPHE